MKRMIRTAFVYLILGLAAGVFFREYTKFMGYEGITALKSIHPHFLALGMGLFLLLALFVRAFPSLPQEKTFRWFYGLYNTGLVITGLLMLVRGVIQVQGLALTSGLDAAISGMAGVGHILLAAGLFCLFAALSKAVPADRN